MKKTLTLIALLGASSLAMGETLLNLDFTSTDTTLAGMTGGTLENGGQWTLGYWQGSLNQFKIDNTGLYAGEGNGWNRSYGSTSLGSALDFSTNAYVFELKLVGTTTDYNDLLVFSGANGSYVFGHSYNTDTGFHAGSLNSNVFASDSKMPIFGTMGNTAQVSAFAQTDAVLEANQAVTYRVEIMGSNMTVSFIGANKTIFETYTVDSSLGNFDTIGLVLDGPNSKVKSLTATSTAYLTWAGDADSTWGDGGAGFHQGSTTTAATYSDDSDSIVVFSSTTAQTVNVAETGVTPHTMIVTGDYTFNGGNVNATTLKLTGAVALRGTSTLNAESIDSSVLTALTLNDGKELTLSNASALTSLTTDATSKLITSGDLTVAGHNLSVSGELKVGSSDAGSMLELKNGAGLTVNSGSLVTTGQLHIHNQGTNTEETVTIDGGVVNVLSSATSPDTHGESFHAPGEEYGIIIGHWGGNGSSGALTVENSGVLNATECSTAVGWDSAGTLTIKGASQANLYGINNTGRTNTSLVKLEGGSLNLGALGYKGQSNSKLVVAANSTGSTLGTLAETEITVDETIELNAGLTINSAVQAVDETTGVAGNKKNAQGNDIAGSIKITGSLTGAGALEKTGLGTLTLTGTNTGYTGNVTVNGGTLAVADGAGWGSGTVTVADAATLSLSGDHTVDASKISLSTEGRGGYLQIASGTTTLTTTAADKTWTVERGDSRTTGNIKLGDGNNVGTLKLKEGYTLVYEGNSYTGKSGDGTISGKAYSGSNTELSMWNGNQTVNNMVVSLTIANNRDVNASYTDSDVTLDGGYQYTLKGSEYSFSKLDVKAGTTALVDNTNTTVNGTASEIAGKLTHAAGKSVEIAGSATVSGSGSIQSSGNDPSVLIAAKQPVTRDAGATSASATVSGITVSDSGITGADGKISDAAVTLKGGNKTVSGITFEDTTVDLSEATELALSNVVFGSGTVVSGSAKVGGDNTFVLTEAMVDNVEFVSEEGGVVVTYGGFGTLDFTNTSSITLHITEGFLTALQKVVAPDSTDVLTFVFEGSEGLGAGTTVGATLAPSLASWATVGDVAVAGANSVMVTFTPQTEIATIPEPATAALSLLALAGLSARRRRKH